MSLETIFAYYADTSHCSFVWFFFPVGLSGEIKAVFEAKLRQISSSGSKGNLRIFYVIRKKSRPKGGENF